MALREPSNLSHLWRSKERSDAAQTLGSMPRHVSVATVQNSAPLHSSINVTEWILGSPRRRFAAAPPVDDEVVEAPALDCLSVPFTHE
jgi:hypothetical protein